MSLLAHLCCLSCVMCKTWVDENNWTL